MKIAVITGAASGIGREFAKRVSTSEYGLDELWLIDMNGEALDEFAQKLKVKSKLFAMDISLEESIEQIKAVLASEAPQIHMLVNCAGFGTIGWFSETDIKRQLDMIDVNCRALTAVTYMCIPYLMQGGKVLNMSSGAGLMPQPRFAVYAASKAYVLSFSRAINQVLKRKGITACAICAGPVKTNFYRTAVKKSEYKKETRGLKMQSPAEIVEIALCDAEKGKDVCYPSGFMRFTAVLTKVVPMSGLLKFVMGASVKKYGIRD